MDGSNTHPVGAERQVLGNLLMYGSKSLSLIEEIVDDESWSSRQHAAIFGWVKSSVKTGSPVSPIALTESVGSQGILHEKYGGADYIFSLPDSACTIVSLVQTARTVSNGSKLRRLRREHELGIRRIEEGAATADELVVEAESRIMNISMTSSARRSSVSSMADVYAVARPRAERVRSGDVSDEFVQTFYPSFDAHYTGWRRGYVSYLGGRAKQCKTMFALSTMLRGVLPSYGDVVIPHGMISLEMSKPDLMYRMSGTLAGVNWTRILNQEATDEEAARFFKAMEAVRDLPIYIDADARSLDAVVAAIRRMARVHRCPCVYIDYYQLIKTSGSNSGETSGYEAICDELRAVAKHEDIALVCLAQLNPACEARVINGRRGVPRDASDFRWSEKPVQDSWLAAGMYREFHYHPPAGVGGKTYTEEQLKDAVQPIEFIPIGARGAARKPLELWVRLDVGQVYDPRDPGFTPPDWNRGR